MRQPPVIVNMSVDRIDSPIKRADGLAAGRKVATPPRGDPDHAKGNAVQGTLTLEGGGGKGGASRKEGGGRIGKDGKFFPSARGSQPNRRGGLPSLYRKKSDPPQHTAWRSALNPHLSPMAVAGYEAPIRKDVNTLID